MIVLNKILKY